MDLSNCAPSLGTVVDGNVFEELLQGDYEEALKAFEAQTPYITNDLLGESFYPSDEVFFDPEISDSLSPSYDTSSTGTLPGEKGLGDGSPINGYEPWTIPPVVPPTLSPAKKTSEYAGAALPHCHNAGVGATRKMTHAEREKCRVQTIGAAVDTLRDLVPGCDDHKVPRATVLQRCTAYILQNRQQIATMSSRSELLAKELQQVKAENAQLKVFLSVYFKNNPYLSTLSPALLGTLPQPSPIMPNQQRQSGDCRPGSGSMPFGSTDTTTMNWGPTVPTVSNCKAPRPSRVPKILPWSTTSPERTAPSKVNVNIGNNGGFHPTLLYTTVPIVHDVPAYLGNTRALMGLCFFLLLSPTCKILFTSTDVATTTTGRVLSSTDEVGIMPTFGRLIMQVVTFVSNINGPLVFLSACLVGLWHLFEI